MDVFECQKPDNPSAIIISVPHAGTFIPDDIAIKDSFRDGLEDCDLFVDQLYSFAGDLAITLIKANYSRYVVDLNRDPSGKALYNRRVTEVVPKKSFKGEDLYGEGIDLEVLERINMFHRPYHDELQLLIDELLEKHPRVLLYDAHSINRHVPELIADPLPDFMLGNNDGESCDEDLFSVIKTQLEQSVYTLTVNKPFKGGFITRSFGKKGSRVSTIQLERSIDTYCSERVFDNVKAKRQTELLRQCFEGFLQTI